MITIEQLTGIVLDASKLMVTDGFEIEQKSGYENIVTSSDVAVQNHLCERLLEKIPHSGFLCEEKDINDTRRFGACAPELCYLAMGRCELYFEYLLSPWDYAAASLIVSEAGGVITSADGSRLCLTKPTGVIAANCMSNYKLLLDIVSNR